MTCNDSLCAANPGQGWPLFPSLDREASEDGVQQQQRGKGKGKGKGNPAQ
jgi:hypothetical protein